MSFMSRRRVAVVLSIAAVAIVIAMAGWMLLLEKQASYMRIGFVPEEGEHGLQIVEILPRSSAASAGLQEGDLLTAVDGHPVTTEADYDAIATGFSHGERVTFTIDRNGTQKTLVVHPGSPMRWRPPAIDLLLALCYLAVGILAYLQSPDDLRARLLFIFSCSVALEMALVQELVFGGTLYVARTAAYFALSGIQMALELHLASVIPQRALWLHRHPWLVKVYYAVGLGLGAITSIGFLGAAYEHPVLPWDFDLVESAVFDVGTVVWAVAVVAILWNQTVRARELRRRHQALLVLLGVMPWAVFTLVWEGLAAFQLPLPAWLEGIQPAVLLVYPVAVFIAIFRYSLFDIEVVVRRSLVYTSLTTSLILVFYAALGAGGALFSQLVEGGEKSVWVIAGATLLMGLLFSPLREVLQREIDRRVFPERVAMRQRLTALAGNLPAQGSLPSMGQHLVEELAEIFALRSATLLVADPKSGLLVTLSSTAVDLRANFDQSFLLQPDDPGLTMLQRIGRPLRADQVETHSGALSQRMHAFDARLLVGLPSGDTLTGLLMLGGKESGERFGAEEIELLGLFAHNVATVLENARLFESATYEGLTGLLRREAVLAMLDRELHRAQRYRRPLTVGMADIDRFKRINDRFGHLAGDALLKRVAQTLVGGLRASDTIGRYGGEEFLFILPETELEGAVQVAEKLRQRVAEMESPVEGVRGEVLTISIGLATLDLEDEAASPTTLIATADRHLLRAKREGRNRVVPGSDAAA